MIITKAITLKGDPGATIQAPAAFTTTLAQLPPQFTTDNLFIPQAIVIVWGTGSNANIINLNIAGPLLGNNSCADDRSIIHDAGKNSVRRFLMQRHMNAEGKMEGLIADATIRIQIDKASLLKLTPLYNFDENDKVTTRRFRKWLAKRYDRPALPDELVLAIQRPVIKAIDKLHLKDNKHRILDGISEILFLPRNNAIPFLIDMLFIRDERSDAPIVNEEDAAQLAGWISDVLRKEGQADLTNWELFSLREIISYWL